MITETVIDPCVECGLSTAPGSGRWVNRLPADDGFKCIECLGSVFECDRCGEDIPFDADTTVIDQEQGSRHEIRVGVDCCYKDTDQEADCPSRNPLTGVCPGWVPGH